MENARFLGSREIEALKAAAALASAVHDDTHSTRKKDQRLAASHDHFSGSNHDDILLMERVEEKYSGPVQDGPLAFYPVLAAVDQQQKWQRITNWINYDSADAAHETIAEASSPLSSLHQSESSKVSALRSSQEQLLEDNLSTGSLSQPNKLSASERFYQDDRVEQSALFGNDAIFTSDDYQVSAHKVKEHKYSSKAANNVSSLVSAPLEKETAKNRDGYMFTESKETNDYLIGELSYHQKTIQKLETELKWRNDEIATLSSSEMQSRMREKSLAEVLEATKQCLEYERSQAAALAEDYESSFQKQELAWQLQLEAAEAKQEEAEGRLADAGAEVAHMREELVALQSRLSVREEAFLSHMQENKEQHTRTHKLELERCQQQLAATTSRATSASAALLKIHSALSPAAIAAAFGHDPMYTSRFSAYFDAYDAVDQRFSALASGQSGFGSNTQLDIDGMLSAVRTLLAQAGAAHLNGERLAAAGESEWGGAVEALRDEAEELKAEVAALMRANEALQQEAQARSVERDHELTSLRETVAALEAQLHTSTTKLTQEHAVAAAALQLAKESAEREVVQLSRRLEDAKAEGVAAVQQAGEAAAAAEASQMRVAALTAQVERLTQDNASISASLNAKENRIQELRSAISTALSGRSSSEDTLRAELTAEISRAEAAEAAQKQAEEQCSNLDSQLRSLQEQHQQLQQQWTACQQLLSSSKSAATNASEAYLALRQAVTAAAIHALECIKDRSQLRSEVQSGVLSTAQAEANLTAASVRLETLASVVSSVCDPSDSVSMSSVVSLLNATVTAQDAVMLSIAAEGKALQVKNDEVGVILAQCHGQIGEAIENMEQIYAGAFSEQSMSRRSGGASMNPARNPGLDHYAADLTDLIKTLKKTVSSTIAAYNSMQEHTARADQQSTTLLEQLRDSERQVETGIERQEALQRELDTALAEHQRRVQEMMLDMESLRQASGGTSAAAAAAIQQQSVRHKEEVQALHAKLTATTALARDAGSALQTLQGERRQLQTTVERLQAQLNDTTQDLKSTTQLLSTEKELRAEADQQLRDHQRELAQLQQQNLIAATALSNAKEDMSRMEQASLVAKQQRHVEATRLRVLRQRRNAAMSEVLLLRRAKASLEKQVQQGTDAVRVGTNKLKKAIAERDTALQKATELESKLERGETLVPKLEERRTTLEADKRRLTERVSRLSGAHAGLETALADARSRTMALNEQLDAAQARASNEAARNLMLMSQLEAAEAALRDSQKTAVKLRAELETMLAQPPADAVVQQPRVAAMQQQSIAVQVGPDMIDSAGEAVSATSPTVIRIPTSVGQEVLGEGGKRSVEKGVEAGDQNKEGRVGEGDVKEERMAALRTALAAARMNEEKLKERVRELEEERDMASRAVAEREQKGAQLQVTTDGSASKSWDSGASDKVRIAILQHELASVMKDAQGSASLQTKLEAAEREIAELRQQVSKPPSINIPNVIPGSASEVDSRSRAQSDAVELASPEAHSHTLSNDQRLHQLEQLVEQLQVQCQEAEGAYQEAVQDLERQDDVKLQLEREVAALQGQLAELTARVQDVMLQGLHSVHTLHEHDDRRPRTSGAADKGAPHSTTSNQPVPVPLLPSPSVGESYHDRVAEAYEQAVQSLTTRIHDLQAQLQLSQAACEALKKERDELQLTIAEQAESVWTTPVQQQQRASSALMADDMHAEDEETRARLRCQLMEAEVSRDEAVARYEAAARDLEHWAERSRRLEVALGDTEQAAVQAQGAVQKLERQVEILQADLAAAKRQILMSSSHPSSSERSARTSVSGSMSSDSRQLCTLLQNQLSALSAELASAREDAELSRTQAQAASSRVQELTSYVADLEAAVQEAAEQLASCRADLEAARQVADDQSGHTAVAEAKLVEAQQRCAGLSQELDQIQLAYAAAKSESESLSASILVLKESASAGQWAATQSQHTEEHEARRVRQLEAEGGSDADAVLASELNHTRAQVTELSRKLRGYEMQIAEQAAMLAVAEMEGRQQRQHFGDAEQVHSEDLTQLKRRSEHLQLQLSSAHEQARLETEALTRCQEQAQMLSGVVRERDSEIAVLRGTLVMVEAEKQELQKSVQKLSAAQSSVPVTEMRVQTAADDARASRRLHELMTENKDLVLRLTATYSKLKATRAKLAQKEALLERQGLHVNLPSSVPTAVRTNRPSASVSGTSGTVIYPPYSPDASTGRETSETAVVPARRVDLARLSGVVDQGILAEIEAYKVALASAQEEASIANASCIQARAQVRELEIALSRRSGLRSELLVGTGTEQSAAAASALPTADIDTVLGRQPRHRLGMPAGTGAERTASAASALAAADIDSGLGRRPGHRKGVPAGIGTEQTTTAATALAAVISQQSLEAALAEARLGGQACAAEAAEWRQRATELEHKVASTELELEESDTRAQQLQDRLAMLEAELKRLSASTPSPFQAAAADSLAYKRRQGIDGLQGQVNRLTETWREAREADERRRSQLKSVVKELQEKRMRALRELLRFAEQAFRAESELQAQAANAGVSSMEAQRQLVMLTAQLEGRNRQVEELGTLVTALRGTSRDAVSECEHLRAELRDVRAKLAASQAKDERGRVAQAAAETELAKLKSEQRSSSTQLGERQAEVESAKRQMETLRSTLANVEAGVTRMAGTVLDVLHELGADEGDSATEGPATTSAVQLLERLVALLVREVDDYVQRSVQVRLELEAGLAAQKVETEELQTQLSKQAAAVEGQLNRQSQSASESAALTARTRALESDLIATQTALQQRESEYAALRARLLRQEEGSASGEATAARLTAQVQRLEQMLQKGGEELEGAQDMVASLRGQLATKQQEEAALQEQLRVLQSEMDGAVRRQSQSSVLVKERDSALESARDQLKAALAQLATQKEQLEHKEREVRELQQMLKAWEAMRLGKDAQLAAVTERCRRHEEDAAEKGRQCEALRRKLAAVTRSSGAGASIASSVGSLATPIPFHSSPSPESVYRVQRHPS